MDAAILVLTIVDDAALFRTAATCELSRGEQQLSKTATKRNQSVRLDMPHSLLTHVGVCRQIQTGIDPHCFWMSRSASWPRIDDDVRCRFSLRFV